MSETTRNIGITEDAFITKMEVYLKFKEAVKYSPV